ncbi:MAG: M36 family metallopeptidase [Chloroflexi bacterium]|nr:M36 family metallopeptidase [Chloroflexota bacterium]MBP8056140.1 M36 family metallopeptidase [Chloroflexota bacterium]
MKSSTIRTLLGASLLLFSLWLTQSAAASSTPLPEKTPILLPSTFPQNRSLKAENDLSFLTGPNSGDPLTIALDFFRAHKTELGLTASDTIELLVTDQYTSEHTGTTHIYLRQQWQGLPVADTLTSINIAADGQVVNLYTNFVANLEARIVSQTPQLTAGQAVHAAATALGLVITDPLVIQDNIGGLAQAVVFSHGGISLQPIPVRQVYQPVAGGSVHLAWAVEIYELSSQHWWNIRVDAATGEALAQNDYVVNENGGESDHAAAFPPAAFQPAAPTTTNQTATQSPLAPDSYRVYPMPIVSPIYTTPAPPADARVLVNNPANALASPYGWHDTNGAAGAEFTITQGNNVYAYVDAALPADSPDPGSAPDGGAGLVFDFPLDLTLAPINYRPAAVTNLFYWNNIIHDVYYQYGFTEAAGNFQQNNYGRGGTGADYVFAEAQDLSGTNNANFATPADGSNPRMQMFIGTNPNPDVDGDLDNHVIVHEYGHGISNRLTGGPGNVTCLQNSEQMGEGWSDWLGLVITTNASETSTTNRPVGNYLFGMTPTAVGIRPAPYTTDMAVNNYTYSNLPAMIAPHGVGFVWATMLWDMYWNLVNQYGFNSDFYGDWNTGGNNLAIQLVMDGMKLQPCSPGFVDGRNAILQADTLLTGGRNQCHIWAAFARRGLGFSASQGNSSSSTDGTAAFDMPVACQLLNAPTFPASQSICVTSTNSVTYDVLVGSSFTTPVTLNASGNPAGSTTSFAPNPVTAVPRYSTLTVDNLLGTATGDYTITINGTGVATDNTTVGLNVVNAIPTITTLATPANSSTSVPLFPTLTWNAAANASSYVLEVDDDPTFSTINHTATIAGTSHTLTTALSPTTLYYWRVRATNGCGISANSTVFTFITQSISCTTYASTDVPKRIPATGTSGTATSTLVIAGSSSIIDLNVRNLSGTHTWINDLSVQLTSPTATIVQIMNQSCANQDNFNLNLDDEATPGAWPCPPTTGGTYQPSNPLSSFDGQNANGTWTLQITDNASSDSGQLNSWGLEICTSASFNADYSDLPIGYGVAWHTGTGTLRLGTNWTADTTFLMANDDGSDDGITRVNPWEADKPATLAVNVTGTGASPWLAGWIDWNENGVFETPSERMVDQAVTIGPNSVVFTVDGSYVAGTTVQARFRLFDSQPLAPLSNASAMGAAANGEVEDYTFAFGPTAITLRHIQIGSIGAILPGVVALGAAASLFWLRRRHIHRLSNR